MDETVNEGRTPNSTTTPDAPAVSVLLAVHNGARYLEEALRSMMRQSLRNIEILVVDDASIDATPEILSRLAQEDPRLRILTTPENLRLAGALNYGLDHARAPLIARMDDDDISYPERLAIQKRFMDAHPGVTLAGASVDWLDDSGGRTRRSVRSRDDFAIRWTARFALNIIHPTFMFRDKSPSGDPVRYDPELHVGQDYDLVCRLLMGGSEVVCLPEVLLAFRRHGNSISRKKGKDQLALAKGVCETFQAHELPPPLVDALAPMRNAFYDMEPLDAEEIAAIFSGGKAMLAHDLARHPDRASWLRRQTAQYVAWTLQRCRVSKTTLVRSFFRHTPELLPALGLRVLETRRILPRRLYADPPVWRNATLLP
jgi:Glycosyl transferase family 2